MKSPEKERKKETNIWGDERSPLRRQRRVCTNYGVEGSDLPRSLSRNLCARDKNECGNAVRRSPKKGGLGNKEIGWIVVGFSVGEVFCFERTTCLFREEIKDTSLFALLKTIKERLEERRRRREEKE